ncbi:hypothetical protein EMCG_04397 [[Emmonsia] crescens]|uniref:Aminoglycoside phosphotransferase domain-containing protein n=1 Tax=[Emmonsia] crescens TaxID=73230 RepID=A0A0G2IYY4_9EURO|nr:hypothetical protein EMCG_04397 [Emmonsia crescens UAMH 3008]
MDRERFHQKWIGDLFDAFPLWCPDGTVWEIGKKLSERASFAPAEISGTGWAIAEAQAVYICHQVEGPSIGMEAIVKVRLQVPPKYPPNLNPHVRRKLALTNPSFWTAAEVSNLRHFNQKGCKVTPKLLAVKRSLQEWDCMPVPGGYLVFMVMERVPGVPLVDFWDYDFEKREKIRAAFQEGLKELFSHHGRPMDNHLGNIIYDEENNKCWFVDYEDVHVNEKRKPKEFTKSEYFFWGLASHEYGEVEEW